MRKENLVTGRIYSLNTIGTMFTDYARKPSSDGNGYYPNFKAYKVGDALKYTGKHQYGTIPIFEHISTKELIAIHNCACISELIKPTQYTRQEKIAYLKESINQDSTKYAKLENELAILNKKLSDDNKILKELEKYPTDEAALAAKCKEIIASGGNESKILDVIKKFKKDGLL